jgi:hypothetical protein
MRRIIRVFVTFALTTLEAPLFAGQLGFLASVQCAACPRTRPIIQRGLKPCGQMLLARLCHRYGRGMPHGGDGGGWRLLIGQGPRMRAANRAGRCVPLLDEGRALTALMSTQLHKIFLGHDVLPATGKSSQAAGPQELR